jgi:hypothetical protein
MHEARTEARAETWDKSVFSMLDLAKTPEELEERLLFIIDSARRAAWGIRRRKGWGGTAQGATPSATGMAVPHRDSSDKSDSSD